MVYCRWGRVGVKGQDKLHGPYSSQDSAIQEFEQKFLAKTRNYWSNRKEFICQPRSYAWLEMDYTDREKESDVSCHNGKRHYSGLVAEYINMLHDLEIGIRNKVISR